MPRTLRTTLPDGYFHAYSRAVFRVALFRDDDDRRVFLKLLLQTARRRTWHLEAVCLMTTHYHLVLRTTIPVAGFGHAVVERRLRTAVQQTA